jgi:hypothetical protein
LLTWLAILAIAVTAPWFCGTAVWLPCRAAPAPSYVEHQLFPHPDASVSESVRHALSQIREGGKVPHVQFHTLAQQRVAAEGAIALLVLVDRADTRTHACR